MKSFYLKIILPAILAVALFILIIFRVIIPQFQESIMNGKRQMITELTNSAWSILAKYESDEQKGLLTREEAQRTAISRIQYLRYGDENKDYFWITDMHPMMMMHPYRTDLNGKDLTTFKDPHGKHLFVEFVKTVKRQGHGYVDYMWQWKDDSLHIVPKLSYVKLFKPWGWVIGTGIYIEDVKKETDALTQKLLWISICIILLIASLLLFVSQQSLKIEKQRILAENKLLDSKEKYKALVEATTEGLIMLADGKVNYINKVITRMTGFTMNDLQQQAFNFIISDNNNPELKAIFAGTDISEGQYQLNIRKKEGGFTEALVMSSTANFQGQSVHIIIIKEISNEKQHQADIDFSKLLNTKEIGYFKCVLSGKGKINYANEKTIRLLGFESSEELQAVTLIDIVAFAEELKKLKEEINTHGFAKHVVLHIKRKDNNVRLFSITLLLSSEEHKDLLVCDGILEDITNQAKQEADQLWQTAQLKASGFILEQLVSDYLSPVHHIDTDATIRDAVKLMAMHKTDCLLVTKNNKDYIGIVTSTDLQQRVLSLGLQADNPIYLVMSAPLMQLSEQATIATALMVFKEKKIKHLIVKSNEQTKVLQLASIVNRLNDSLDFYMQAVHQAETISHISDLGKQFRNYLKAIIHSDIRIEHITAINARFSDAVHQRIIDLCLKQAGEVPVSFSFICLGSEGRQEETLLTDQDNAIIYEDVDKEHADDVHHFFMQLGDQICNALAVAGYAFCRGNIMARTSAWCQPYSKWEENFSTWVKTPTPQNLLDATIFFDFRHIYGNEEFTVQLRQTVNKLIKASPLFLYQLAHTTYNIKLPVLSSGTLISDKHNESIDLKQALSIIVMFARTYALQQNSSNTNTCERLKVIQQLHMMNSETIREALYAYNHLMKLRFLHQVSLLNNNKELNNQLQIKNLTSLEIALLKRILQVLPALQNKIAGDFRVIT